MTWRIGCCVLMGCLCLAGGAQAEDGPSPPPRVPNVDGTTVAPLPMDEQVERPKAVVLLFIAADCPISNSYAPEIQRLTEAYTSREVALYLVHTDTAVTADQAREHAAAHELTAPVLLDPGHRLAAYATAAVTPEAVLFTWAEDEQVWQRRYRGMIDDLWADFGVSRPEPSQRYLRDALDAVLADEPVPVAETEPLGCFIPFDTADDRPTEPQA